MRPEREREVFDAAVESLRGLPGAKIEVETGKSIEGGSGYLVPDAVVVLETDSGQQKYLVETKSINQRTVNGVVGQLLKYSQLTGLAPLLVTHHATETLVDALVRDGVEFVDTAGNMYLKSPAYHAFVRGKSPESSKPTDPFTVTGLKVLYALLAFPELRGGTYRELATASGVGLGSVSRTVHSLLEQGHLIKGRSGILHIAEFRRVLERWELGYLETLRPRLEPSGWRLTSTERARVLRSLPEGVLVGGEEAAGLLTDYLKPQTITLHADKRWQKDMQIRLRLLPERERPDIHLLTTLTSSYRYVPKKNVAVPIVHPILVRAELLFVGGDRLREVAARLLEDLIMPEEEAHA
jgi:hypothetical protein